MATKRPTAEERALRRIKRISNATIVDAAISRDQAHTTLIEELLGLFDGRPKPLMARLVESGTLTLDDIKEAEVSTRRKNKRARHSRSPRSGRTRVLPQADRLAMGLASGPASFSAPNITLLPARLPAVGRRVFDRTGLNGRFDFDLEWTPLGPAAPVLPTDRAPDAARRSSLLQEQLDLKLESTKETIPVLVIDSVNKPSAN